MESLISYHEHIVAPRLMDRPDIAFLTDDERAVLIRQLREDIKINLDDYLLEIQSAEHLVDKGNLSLTDEARVYGLADILGAAALTCVRSINDLECVLPLMSRIGSLKDNAFARVYPGLNQIVLKALEEMTGLPRTARLGANQAEAYIHNQLGLQGIELPDTGVHVVANFKHPQSAAYNACSDPTLQVLAGMVWGKGIPEGRYPPKIIESLVRDPKQQTNLPQVARSVPVSFDSLVKKWHDLVRARIYVDNPHDYDDLVAHLSNETETVYMRLSHYPVGSRLVQRHKYSGRQLPQYPARHIINVCRKNGDTPDLVYAAVHAHFRGDRGQGIELQVAPTLKAPINTILDVAYKGLAHLDTLGFQPNELAILLREEQVQYQTFR